MSVSADRPDELALRLRAARQAAGLTGKALAEVLSWQPSKVSRIELGRQQASETDVVEWSRACGLGSDALHELEQLAAWVRSEHHRWRIRMVAGQEHVQRGYNDLVASSHRIWHFETALFPGLLQTPAYARHVLVEMVVLHQLEVDDVDAAVAARMARQQVLYEGGRSLRFLVAEPVLHWQVVPVDVMRAQLDRLQTVVGLPGVELGVLPYSAAAQLLQQNAFQLYDEVAVVETFVGETVHRGAQAQAYREVMERLWSFAVTGDAVRSILVDAAAALLADRPGRADAAR